MAGTARGADHVTKASVSATDSPAPPPLRPRRRQPAEQQRVRTRPLVETRQLVFLVRAVDLIVVQAEAHHQRVDPQHALDLFHHRNRAAAADHHRRPSVFVLQRLLRRPGPQRIGVDLDPHRHAEGLD